MSKEKKTKEFTYGDRLGRITGEGRFNNINSIIVNSHRYFQKDKEEKNRNRIIDLDKNKYYTNFNEKNFDKYRYYPDKEDEGIKMTTNDYYNLDLLKEVGKSEFNYSGSNLKMNNKPSYFRETNFSLPQSFNSIGNKQSDLLNHVSNLRNSYMNIGNKNDSIEKIFYNYNNNFGKNNNNNYLINSSTTMPKFYTLDNGFTSGYQRGNPMARSYSVDSNKRNEIYKNNIYESVSNKPELYEKDNLKPNYDNSFLNTSKYFQPNTQRDFHGIYDSSMRTSFLNTKNNLGLNTENNERNSFYDSHKKLMLTLSPNIILNTIQEEQTKKELETFHQSSNTFFRDENEYTIKQCSCVKEYSIKKYHNIPYHISQNCELFALDRFDTKLTDGFFGVFEGINGNEVSNYLRQNLPNLFQRMVHFNPKKIVPYHPPGTKPDKKIAGIGTSIESIFLNLFLKLDDDIKIMKCLDVGATACVIYLVEEEDELTGFKQKKKFIYCASVGDTQCIVISKTRATKLTKIHNIKKNPEERKRIENIGGVVFDEKIYGQENITRAFGMFNLKQYGITCIPECTKIGLSNLDQYVVIGTRGVFEALTDGDLHNICSHAESTETIIKNIVQNCINRFTRDNLGIIVIKL